MDGLLTVALHCVRKWSGWLTERMGGRHDHLETRPERGEEELWGSIAGGECPLLGVFGARLADPPRRARRGAAESLEKEQPIAAMPWLNEIGRAAERAPGERRNEGEALSGRR
ncbi:hypothetical protein NDU88_004050 [Pleurodeles waltl]|uniref:Uncharacterized protein n=1 Tax=Pleurodeles waltl TaxID=8319 RepID=A0AAV7NRE9_PLEWA|nr:hypothetical protein NDU88_004050 [Pleurodeles waltl]